MLRLFDSFGYGRLTAKVDSLIKKDFERSHGKETWNLYNHLEVKKEGKVGYAEAVANIEKLRELHKQMDEAVLAAYGWHEESPAMQSRDDGETGVKIEDTWPAIDLRHDFYEIDYLPENDRIRYTIHPDARKEILKRLLLLNHKIYAEEVAQGLHGKKGKGKKKSTPKTTKPDNPNQLDFGF